MKLDHVHIIPSAAIPARADRSQEFPISTRADLRGPARS